MCSDNCIYSQRLEWRALDIIRLLSLAQHYSRIFRQHNRENGYCLCCLICYRSSQVDMVQETTSPDHIRSRRRCKSWTQRECSIDFLSKRLVRFQGIMIEPRWLIYCRHLLSVGCIAIILSLLMEPTLQAVITSHGQLESVEYPGGAIIPRAFRFDGGFESKTRSRS